MRIPFRLAVAGALIWSFIPATGVQGFPSVESVLVSAQKSAKEAKDLAGGPAPTADCPCRRSGFKALNEKAEVVAQEGAMLFLVLAAHVDLRAWNTLQEAQNRYSSTMVELDRLARKAVALGGLVKVGETYRYAIHIGKDYKLGKTR